MKAIAYPLIVSAFAAFLCQPTAFAQELVWAADAEGGAPYTFPDPRDPSHIIGFEVDLANALAQHMGRKARFVQNQWDELDPEPERGEYDDVSNGQETTAHRADNNNSTTPNLQPTPKLTQHTH